MGPEGNGPRIVSLLPSATEIVCALGAERELVGISHECDFPSTITGRPVLTKARIDASASSRAIDAAVRAVVDDALSIYVVDDTKLAALEPDVIVTQDLCEVCAVSLDDVRAAVARLARRDRVHIVSLKPTRLDDLYGDVQRVAEAIGRADEGVRLQSDLRERIRAIAERAAQSTTRPRVASIEWIDPLMVGGTWMPDLVLHAGGEAVGAVAGQPAPTVTSETLASLRPDVIVVKPCGFSLDRTMAERDVIQRSVLDRIPSGTRVYVTDGNAFFNRPGPRLIESLEIMAACVHPARFEDFEKKHRSVIHRLR
jgi:iron complex transport system substrate-binding protein